VNQLVAEEKNPQTVFVVDDDDAVRSSLHRVLNESGYSVESFVNAEDYLDNVSPARRGCLVLDVRMPGLSGIELLEKLRQDSYSIPAIMFSGYAEISDCVLAMRHGAVDFLEKPYRTSVLLDAVEKALAIEVELRENMVEQAETKKRLNSLTVDEKHVLKGILSGQIQKSIASSLDISLRTVQLKRSKILEKFQMNSISELLL